VPATEGVGPCHAGVQTCAPDGLGWSACQGQVLPISEICGNAVDDDCNGLSDDVADLDGDGWTACDGDCSEVDLGNGKAIKINPGAYEILGNGVDDDCDPTTPDQGVSTTCSTGTLLSGVTPLDLAKAMDICQVALPNPPLAQKTWGLLDASFLLADGSSPSPAQLDTMQSLQTAVLPKFGDAFAPKQGLTFAGLSTGKMRDAHSADFVPAAPGTDLGSASSPPAAYLAAHAGLLPSSPPNNCNGPCPSGAGAFDSVRLRLTLRAPTNMGALSFDQVFLSAEHGAHSCSPYNDAFLALLQSQVPGLPLDKNIAFDSYGKSFLANGVTFESCVAQGCSLCPAGTAQLAGTGMESGAATTWLTADAPIVPGETFQLDLMIFDVTDGSGDSHVLLDNFRWRSVAPPCEGDWSVCG
jgi:hypothetical protein